MRLNFTLGDITNASLWADATAVFMMGTCFPEDVIVAVAEATAQLPVGTRFVVASFPLPDRVTLDRDRGGAGGSNRLALSRKIVLPTSFSHGEPFYFYDVV